MRGKAGIAFQCSAVPGITPAYAGKSGGVKLNQMKFQDHPRLCGEKQVIHKRDP